MVVALLHYQVIEVVEVVGGLILVLLQRVEMEHRLQGVRVVMEPHHPFQV
jgi:hypothetical protein